MSLRKIVEKWGGSQVRPMELYADLFRLGEGLLQREGEPPGLFKANPVIVGHSGGEGGRMHRKIMFEDTFAETLAEFQAYDWAFMAPVTYFGRVNAAGRQSKLWAFVFDLDGVNETRLNNLLSGAIDGGAYPVPQYVVLSGHGVHLYYVLEEPLDLYPGIKEQAKELKFALTRKLWNRYTSSVKAPQYQGINQGFRVPGSRTKPGARLKVCRAMRLSPHPCTVEELNGFVPEASRVDLSRRARRSAHTLAEAQELYPEWYERVVVGGAEPGQWAVKEDLYRWWLRQVRGGAAYGHRYFCVMCLAIFAAKCGIYDEERVRRDALSLVPYLDSLSPEHPFTEADALSALDCLDARYVKFPRADMAKLSGIDMPANKRNGRRQEVHLAGARAVQEVNDKFNGTNWRTGNGRKPKRDLVRDYARAHPGENHSQIARALGVSRTTVVKWIKGD